MSQIKPGDYVFAYISGCGYVGFGKAASGAVEFTKSEIYEELKDSKNKLNSWVYLCQNPGNNQMCEYVLEVDWIKVLDKSNPIPKGKYFAAPNAFCRLNNPVLTGNLTAEFMSR